MSQTEAKRLFDEANRLWFGEGCFKKALLLYQEALKYDPSDPVILYQLANVLWAFEQFDEVRVLVVKIEQYQDRFSDFGKERFAEEKSRLLDPTPFRRLMPIQTSEIDLEKLDSMGFSHKQWMQISTAAEQRRMFNLAARAEERSFPFVDPDSERERCKLEKENSNSFYDLKLMIPGAKE